jgi:hypothetical protein
MIALTKRGASSVKIETTSLLQPGTTQRRVLFSDETARGLHSGGDEVNRAGIWKDARDWAAWAATLVGCKRADAAGESRPEPGEVEVR